MCLVLSTQTSREAVAVPHSLRQATSLTKSKPCFRKGSESLCRPLRDSNAIIRDASEQGDDWTDLAYSCLKHLPQSQLFTAEHAQLTSVRNSNTSQRTAQILKLKMAKRRKLNSSSQSNTASSQLSSNRSATPGNTSMQNVDSPGSTTDLEVAELTCSSNEADCHTEAFIRPRPVWPSKLRPSLGSLGASPSERPGTAFVTLSSAYAWPSLQQADPDDDSEGEKSMMASLDCLRKYWTEQQSKCGALEKSLRALAKEVQILRGENERMKALEQAKEQVSEQLHEQLESERQCAGALRTELRREQHRGVMLSNENRSLLGCLTEMQRERRRLELDVERLEAHSNSASSG